MDKNVAGNGSLSTTVAQQEIWRRLIQTYDTYMHCNYFDDRNEDC